ncbi:SGNH/GDSL hydrolase family protein [Georgenia alba]|uniref:SGNH/GDSL hydrolase family protein n=1 Tax=Georgenia alba TaxID=2233858 RepID=A0ABW2QA63_9MICO
MRPPGTSLLIGGGVVFAFLAVGCASADGGGTGVTPEPADGAIRLAAVGDSITEADSPDFGAGRLGTESWVHHAVGEDVALVGGWAQWGATTAEMAAAVEPEDADVLVIMAGTNDLGGGEPREETLANIRDIAQTVDAEDVVLSAVPPLDRTPDVATALNADLEALARDEGWHWVDAAAAVRDGERFAEGTTVDGVHPTTRGAELIGARVRAVVLEAAGRGT